MAKPIDPELIRLRRELEKARSAISTSRAAKAKPDDVETIVEAELAAAEAKMRLSWAEDAYQRRFSAVLAEQMKPKP